MADKWYAWSRIQYGANIDPTEGSNQILSHKSVEVGAEVTAEKLGISEQDFQQLIDAGSVREYEFPQMPENYGDSPINFLKHQVRLIEAQAKSLTSGLPSQLQQVGKAPVVMPGNVRPAASEEDRVNL